MAYRPDEDKDDDEPGTAGTWEMDKEDIARRVNEKLDVPDDGPVQKFFIRATKRSKLVPVPRDIDIVPDGNLIEYKLRNPDIGKLEFRFLMVDEAHTAKKLDGAYNHCYRLINWKSLV
ncbi:hypothetical protein HRG_003446 [Hirsutella rhossiliensis]|uniref:Uncharacterized protein n=1 Tax=Hirsutella rhossiliensis TaxID=111463 RepID=A0A9P8N208_9HYPO|nr:uncharacterized protein HRG_03446 [Hirsutella rhossiliensis]KAH0965430.1 hypothetical protein HRG_03446 [Hirsutella rhossiliensis]